MSSCDTLVLTNRLINSGQTLDGLLITNNLPGGGAAYIPNQSTVTMPNGQVLSGAAAEPTIVNGTNLVWDLTAAVSDSGISHVLLTELFYDPSGSSNEETNEWIEIYNPTASAIDLTGYTIVDTVPGQSDALPAISLAAGEYMILCASTQAFTIMHPGYTGKHYQVSDGTIGSSLNNYGDGVLLKNSGGATVDAVSYGTSTAGLSPAATLVTEGNSLTRNPANADNNSASDWVNAAKTPGSGTVLTGVGQGSGVTIVYKMELGCAARSTSVVASVRFQQPAGGATITSNAVYAYTIETPYLNVFKKPLEQVASYGDTVVWTVQVENVGFGRADNVEVIDTRGPGIQFLGFSRPPTNAAPYASLTNVVWNRTTVAELSALDSGESVSIVVTGFVASCTGLYNQVTIRNGCQGLLAATNEICYDSALGGAEGGSIEFNYKYATVSGSLAPAGTTPITYCGGSPLTLYITNAAGANVGYAMGVELEPVLPSGYTLSGSNYVTNVNRVVLGNLAPGAVTSTTVRLIPGGACPLTLDRQQVTFRPTYTDPCGLAYATPPLSSYIYLTNEPAASVRKVMSSSVSGSALNLHVDVLFTYQNLDNTAVSFADHLPNNTNWTVANISSPGALANTTNVRWNVTLTGSGVYTGKFDLTWTDTCAIDTGWRPNLVSASNFTDCAGCTRSVAGSGEATYFRITGTDCPEGTNDVVSCGFSVGSSIPSVAEMCSTLTVTTRVSGLSGNTNASWDNVIFTNTLVGRQASFLGTNHVVVTLDGVDYTDYVRVGQTSTAFVVTFTGLNATAVSRPGLVATEMLISWQISPTNLGQFTDSSSVYVPGCSYQTDLDTLNVGASDLTVELSPLVGQDACGLAIGQIDLQQISTPPLSALSNQNFATYDVEVVLDLDVNRNGTSSYSYFTNSTSFSNMYALVGTSLTGTMPSVTSTQLVWNLGDLRTNGAGSIHFVMQGSCSLEGGEKIVAFARYNRRCEDGGVPARSAYSATNTAAALFTSHLTATIEPEVSFLAGTTYVYRIDFFNSGAATAYNLRGEMAFSSNIIYQGAGFAAASSSLTNAVWTFQVVDAPGDLVDGDADGFEDDLPPNGLVSFYVTNQIGSCTPRLIRLTGSTGCKGSTCEAVTDNASFIPSTPNLATTTYFPSNQLLCATGTIVMIVRNSGAGNAYNAEARHVLPTGIFYMANSCRISVDNGPTNGIIDPAGSGTSADPLRWTSAQIAVFAEMAPNQSVRILYEAYASCEAVLGSSLFTASAQYSDSCANRLTNTASAGTGALNQPVMTVTKTSRNITLGQTGFTSGMVPGNPGDVVAYRISVDHSGTSTADTMSMRLTDILPAAINYQSAWPVPDAVVGANLIWSNTTLMALVGGAPYTRAAAAFEVYVTGTVATCAASVANQAQLEYGCSSACLSMSLGSSSAHSFTPAISSSFLASELQLSSGGGWMVVQVTNSAGSASSMVVTQSAPNGYVITSATITGEYNSSSLNLTLSGSPAGRTSVVSLTTAAASGATDVDDDLADGLSNFDLGYEDAFTIRYRLTADSTALDCTAEPNDADYLDPEPADPSTVSSTTKLGIKNACDESLTASTSASAVPKLPDPDIDLQPNGMYVTNGQVADFTVTMKNRGEEGMASNLSMRIRLGTAWSELAILSNRLVQSASGSIVTELQGSTNILVSLPGVVLDTLDDEVILYLRARAQEGAGSLDVLGEVVGNLNDPSITGCVFTNTLGAAPYADTMSGTTIFPVNGQYYAFDQDRSRVAGFGISKTVRLRSDAAPGGSSLDARVGEDLTYRIEGHFFGVAISNAVIYESLPNNVVWGTPVDVGSSANVSNLWTWSPSAGSFTLPTPLSTDAVFMVDIPVVVSNRVSNQGEIGSQTIFTNVVTNFFQADGITNPPPPSATTTTVKEASLQISKLSGSFGLVQAGETVVFTSRVSHTASSATNAYDLVFTDVLPSGFTFTGVDLGTDGYDNDADGAVDEGDEAGLVSGSTLTITTNNCAALYNLALGQSVSFVFPVKVLNQALGSILVNTGKVVWTSLAGPATNLNERDSSSGVGGLNDYLVTSTATLTSRPVSTITKTMFSTSQDHTTTTNLTIGERVVYKIRVDFPPGVATPVTIVDNVSTGMDFVGTNPSAELTYPGLGYGFYLPAGGPAFPTNTAQGLVVTDADPTPTTSTDLNGSGKNVTFTIPGITNTPDGDSGNDYFELYAEFVILNQTLVNTGRTLGARTGTNVVSYSDTINSVAATSEIYRIAEPDVSARKVRSGSGTVDAGNVIIYSVYASNTVTATANSYDILVTDNLTNKFWDLSSITPLTTAPGWTFSTIASNDLVQIRYTSDAGAYLAPGTGVSNSFSVTVATNIAPNQSMPNRMDILLSDTINGSVAVGTTSRNDTANHTVTITAGNFTLAKALWASSEVGAYDGATTNVQIGEAVTYRLTVTLPEARMTNLVVTDVLPPGLAYVYGSASTDVSTLNGTLGTLTESPTGTGLADNGVDPAITFTGVSWVNGDNNTGNNSFYLYLTAVVLDVPSNTGIVAATSTRLTNTASVTYRGNPSAAVNSGIVVLRVMEPNLAMGKSIVEANADAGDVVTVNLYVTNTGAATAYEPEIQDPLNTTFFDASTAAAVDLPTGFSLFSSNNTVYVRPAVGQVPPASSMEVGEVYTCRFTVAMAATTPPYGFVTNVAHVASADTIYTTNNYDEARDVSGAEAEDSLQSGAIGLIKTMHATSETRPSDSTNDLVQVGEIITYRLEVALPEGTIHDIVVRDFLPAGLAFVRGSAATDTASFNGTLAPLTVLPAGLGLAADGEDVTLSFVGDTVVTGDNEPGNNNFFITLQAVVLDVAGNVGLSGNQTVLTNQADLTFADNPSGPLSANSVTNRVIEPQVSISKDINRTGGDAGDAVILTFVVTNSGMGAAYDLRLEDRLEERFFEPLRVTTGTVPAGFTVVVTGAPDRTIVIQASAASGPKTNTLDPGEALTFTLGAVLSTNVVPAQLLTNAIVVTSADTVYGTASYANERDASGARGNDSLTISNLLIAKSFVSSSANGATDTTGTNITIGEIAYFRLTVTPPESTIEDMVVSDLVPSGMAYVAGSASVDGTGFAGSLPALSVVTAGGDGDDIAFQFTGTTQVTNDNVGSNNRFYIDFGLLMLDVPANDGVPTAGDGDGVSMLTNRATVTCPTCTGTAPTSTAVVVAAAEPYPVVSKRMTQGAGTLMAIAFTVTNRGNSTGYDLDMEDFIPSEVWQIGTLAGAVPAGFQFAISNVADGALIHVWSDPGLSPPTTSLEVNEGITFWFTGTMVEAFSGVAINTAKVTRITTLSGEISGEREEPDTYGTATYGAPDVVAFKRGTDVNGLPLVGGDRILYRITLTNAGGATATGVNLQDLIPTNTTLVAGSVTNRGVASAAGDPGVSLVVGTLTVGQAAVVSFMVTVDEDLPLSVSNIYNRATATWSESARIEVADNDPAGHDTTANDGEDDATDYGATTSDDDPTILPLSSISYTLDKATITPPGRPALVNEAVQFLITVTNSGGIRLATVPLQDTYDTTYLTYANSTPPSADNLNDGVLNWANVGPLNAGQSTSVVVNYTAKAATGTTQTNAVLASPTAQAGYQNPAPATATAPYDVNGSTYASLAAFRVVNSGGVAVVTWETVTEIGTAGFLLLRVDEDGHQVTVGDGWVPAWGSPAGGFYTRVDPLAPAGVAYHYQLQEIGESGGVTPLGDFTGVVPSVVSKGVGSATVSSGLRSGTPVSPVVASKSGPASLPSGADETGQLRIGREGVYGITVADIASLLGRTEPDVQALLQDDGVEVRHHGRRVPSLTLGDGAGLCFYSPGATGLFSSVDVYTVAAGRNPRWMSTLPTAPTSMASDFADTVTASSNRLAIMTLMTDPQADYWVWEQLAVGTKNSVSKSFTLVADDVNANGPARLVLHLWGGSNLSANPDHHVRVTVNGVIVADAWWEGKEAWTVDVPVAAGIVHQGTNTVDVVNVAEASLSSSVFYVDDLSLTYRRALRAKGDYLRFSVDEGQGAEVDGFSQAAVQVLDISEPAAPRLLQGASVQASGATWKLVLPGTKTGHLYVAFTPAAVRAPATFAGSLVAGLTSPTNRAAHLVICAPGLETAGQQLVDHRRSTGVESRLVRLGDIYDAFDSGVSGPDAIRRFLTYAWRYWALAPRDVALLGDGTYDYQNAKGYNDALLPPALVSTPLGVFCSDAPYGDVEGSDGTMEIAVGRIPASSSTGAVAFVQKLIAYELARSTGPASMLLLADNNDSGGDFEADSEAFAGVVTSRFSTTKAYLGALGTAATRQQVLTALNSGLAGFNYAGHGALDRFTQEGVFTSADVASLTNGTRAPLVISMTCVIARYSEPGFPSLGETLLLHSRGGAVAVIGPVGLSSDYLARALDMALGRAWMAGSGLTLGEVWRTALIDYQAQGHDPYLVRVYNIMGDPGTLLP